MNNNKPIESTATGKESTGSGDEEFLESYLDDTLDYDVDPDALLEEDGFSPQQLGQTPGRNVDELPEDIIDDDDGHYDDVGADEPGSPEPLDEEISLAWDETGEEEESWADEEDDPLPETDGKGNWPLGLISVAIIAVLLLAMGGYGVMQQRSEMEQELRRLRAELAIASQPEEAAEARLAVQQLEERNDGLRAGVANLQLENRRLQDTIVGLQAELDATQDVAASTGGETAQTAAPAPAPATPPPGKTGPAATAAAATPAAEITSSSAAEATPGWFVNFSSYRQRAAAEAWAGRLQPDGGTVVIATGEKDGRTFYRVRVIGLADKAEAEAVARQLEREYGVSRLWVGRQ